MDPSQDERKKHSTTSPPPFPRPNEYQTIMERAGHDDKTMLRAISWILNSRWPLRMDELCDLLAYQKGAAGKIFEPREIIQVCKGLIVYDKFSGIVEFPNSTIREFFERNYEGPHMLLSAADLAIICIDYLASDAFDDGPCQDVAALRERLEKHKASLYVAQFWAFYTSGEAEKCPSVQQAIRRLFGSENKKNSMLQMEKYANSYSDVSVIADQTLVHILADKGLATLCRLILNERVNANDTYVFAVAVRC